MLYLHVIRPADDVQHLLEDPLQGQVLIQTRPTGLQQLLQVVPQTQDVVFPHVDPFGVVVPLGLQLPRDVHQGLDALLVRSDIRLNGIVLLLRCLDCRQVVTKVILKGGKQKAEMRSRYSSRDTYRTNTR